MIKIFRVGGVVDGEGGQQGKMLEVGWWGWRGSLRDLSKNLFKTGVGKGKSCFVGGGGFEGVITPPPAVLPSLPKEP